MAASGTASTKGKAARGSINNEQHDGEDGNMSHKSGSGGVATVMAPWMPLRRAGGLLALLPLLLLVALAGIATPAAGAACGATTYNDGYLYTKETGGFTIADPGWSVNGTSFTMEIWLSSDYSSVTRCWWGQGVRTETNGWLHLCIRNTNYLTIGFNNNDLTATSGSITNNNWNHVAMTYDYASKSRTIYLNGASIKNDVATAHYTPSSLAVTIGRADTLRWKGDMDELRWWGSLMSSTDVLQHFNGNFFGAPAPLYWLKFNDGGDTAADSSGAGRAPALLESAQNDISWKSASDSQKCVSGYWSGYMLERVSTASVPVGTLSIYRIYQMDNWGVAMTGYGMAAASVTVQPQGAAGALDSIVVQFRSAAGLFVFTSPLPGTVTQFVLVDSANNGRSTALDNPPPQIFTAATGISAGQLTVPATSTVLELSPPFAPGMFGRTMNATVRALVASVAVRAVWGGGASVSYAAHGRTVASLTSGVDSPALPLSVTPPSFGAGIPCSARPALMAWLPFSNGDTMTDASGLTVPTQAGGAPFATPDRFNAANSAGYFSTRYIVLSGGGFLVPAARMAVSFWFKLSASALHRGLFAVGEYNGNYNRIWVESSGIMWARISGKETVSIPSLLWNDNQWHHVVWQWDAPSLVQQLWVDGGLRVWGSRASSDISNLNVVAFGLGQNGGGDWVYHEGALDDAALFNRALSVPEIRSLYFAEAPPHPQANDRHCFGIVSSTEGSYGLEVLRLPPVVNAVAFQSGRGAVLSSATAPVALSLAPGFDAYATEGYALTLAAFETGLRASASFAGLRPGEGVFASHGGAGTPTELSSDLTAWSPWFPAPVGSSTLTLVTPDGSYLFQVTRATPVVNALTVHGRLGADTSVQADLTAGMTPAFVAGVHEAYSVTIPYKYAKVSFGVSYAPPESAVTTARNSGATEALPAGGGRSKWYTATSGTDMAAVNANRYRIVSTDGTVVVTVTRLPPAVDSVVFAGLPAGTAVPFVAGDVTPRTVAVLGQALTTLSVTVGFNAGPVTVTVNGFAAGSASSGVPLSLTPFLQSADSDTTTVTLATLDGDYSFTFSVGCPLPYTCFRVNQGPECEFRCQFCVAGIMRRICLQERPACCGTADVCTC